MDNLDKFVSLYDNLISLGIIRTQKDLARLMGASESTISKAMKGNPDALTTKLVHRLEVISRTYTKEQESNNSQQYTPKSNNFDNADQPTRTLQGELQLVPTIPYKLYQEENINLMEYIRENVVPMGPAIAQFAQTDLHMFVSNDEMKPHLRAGDVLSLKMVPKDATIINGEIYVINTTNIGIIIRYVYDRGDYLELKSSNEWYEPFQLKKTNVYTIFKILGLVRTNI